MFYHLPPAGNPISLADGRSLHDERLDAFLSDSYFFQSGAASLAAAVVAATRKIVVDNPEVLLPAYACPELVSAVLYAGAVPVLVDLEPDTPWMGLQAIAELVSDQTVAIIAVDLFGIPERVAAIREALGGRDICLIEDSAQGFPERDRLGVTQADMVIYSFGRGKPVSVLGGGAVYAVDGELKSLLADIEKQSAENPQKAVSVKLKIVAYNRLISPRLYWLPEALPFLQLGKTEFHPLEGVSRMDGVRKGLLKTNIDRYWGRGIELQKSVSQVLAMIADGVFADLARSCEAGDSVRLLRYPILFETEAECERAYKRLVEAGMGSSRMYRTSLPGVAGLSEMFPERYAYPHAESFARRLMTLPLHEHVSGRDVATIVAELGGR